MNKAETLIKHFMKKDLPDIMAGDTVKVYQKFKDKDKEKTQIFEGLVIARKHGKEIGATITVRKVVSGVGVERIFPLHLPTIAKIEILKRSKVRRAKLYHLRTAKGKRARLKRIEIKEKTNAPDKIEERPEEVEKPTEEKQPAASERGEPRLDESRREPEPAQTQTENIPENTK
jgi:large subunit ribosomal protein L19